MKRDWIELLDVLYADPAALDAERWASAVVDAMKPVFPGTSVNLTEVCHSADLDSAVVLRNVGAGAARFEPFFERWSEIGGPSGLRAFYYPRTIVSTLTDVMLRLEPETIRFMQESCGDLAWPDAVGLYAHPEPGRVAVVLAPSDQRIQLGSPARAKLTRLALHFEAALRLRLRPENVRAVLSSDGKVHHLDASDTTPPVAKLQQQVGLLESSRGRSMSEETAPLDVWNALVGGVVSLVPRIQGSKRNYLVVENAPARAHFRALSKSELDVVAYASRGLSLKMISYGLGLPLPTVSARLAAAASKIGLATRMELVRVAATLLNDPRAHIEDDELTLAERDVLDLLARGLTNREIAERRGRSVHTIANQVASLLAKTKAPTRRALVAGRAPRAQP